MNLTWRAATKKQEATNSLVASLEFSLQAALSLSRLKPELHAWFGGQRLPILGASSVKKAFTSSHDRGINISGVGSFSASLKYVKDLSK